MARSIIGQQITSAVDKARRSTPGLTIKQATKELGISESSYYKLRAGTRSGQGSIRKRLYDRPHRADGRPQSISNKIAVTFRDPVTGRVASRALTVRSGAVTGVGAFALHHNRTLRKELKRILAEEAKSEYRNQRGSPPWTARERARLEITDVSRTVYGEVPTYYIKAL